MIEEGHGDLLKADTEALINTVNTVGIMGKGIALQFRRVYPEMFKEYERAARAGNIRLGEMFVWATGLLTGPRYVINFPTKGHWRARSKVRDIVAGLDDLVRVLRELEIESVAVPPLGCGNGGLRWSEVEPVIRGALDAVPNVRVLLFAPEGAPAASSMATRERRPPMTAGRAALVALLSGYARYTMASPSLIESQKLMYFLQEAGEPLKLHYQRHHYGPYADNLRHVLRVVEGHYVRGFGDGSARVTEAEHLEVLPEAEEAAGPLLQQHPETMRRIDRVLQLLEGFETPYGLELLASVHWVTHHEDPTTAADADAAARLVKEWSARKGRMFTPQHLRAAWETLCDRGWMDDSRPCQPLRSSAR